MIEGWKYYNHAMIPTNAPHLEVDLRSLQNGEIWKPDKGFPILARWTSEFDCNYETEWWYLIKDQPIVIEELSKHTRKHIRHGLKLCEIKIINPADYIDALYECSHAAFKKYKNASNEPSKNEFQKSCENDTQSVYWAGFDKETQNIIGYFVLKEYSDYVSIITAKFHPDFLNTHISDAMYYTVINYYINEKCKKYVDSGQRNINHITNTQEYKEKVLGYRKAYCRLNIKYRFPINLCIKVLFPFRNILMKVPNKKIHLVVSVLKMEEIHRTFK